jgi:choline dehydrogenase/4-pyridoxate dehydrogenase
LRPFVGKKLAPLARTDADLNAYIMQTGITVHHPLGTCKMGVPTDDLAVVDSNLSVFGTKQLLVVDASVMPDLIGGNINAPVIMIAEKAADSAVALLCPAPPSERRVLGCE